MIVSFAPVKTLTSYKLDFSFAFVYVIYFHSIFIPHKANAYSIRYRHLHSGASGCWRSQ